MGVMENNCEHQPAGTTSGDFCSCPSCIGQQRATEAEIQEATGRMGRWLQLLEGGQSPPPAEYMTAKGDVRIILDALEARTEALRKGFAIWDDGRDYDADPPESNDVVMVWCAAARATLGEEPESRQAGRK